MKLSPDDPKLTAYALGELDPAETEAIERALQDSAELRQAVEEIRQTSAWLKKEFAAEESFTLEPSQKARIEAETPQNVVFLPPIFWRKAVAIGAMAAVFVMALAILFRSQPNTSPLISQASESPGSEAAESIRLEPKSEVAQTAGQLKNGETASVPPAPEAAALASSNLTPHETPAPVAATPSPIELASTDKKSKEAQRLIAGTNTRSGSDGATPASPQPSTLNFYSQTQPAVPPASKRPELARRSQLGGKDLAGTTLYSYGLAAREQEIYPLFDDREARSEHDYFERRRMPHQPSSGETARYPRYMENAFVSVRQNPLSTFSIDVDTASYANVRRFLNEGRMPPRDAVRVEELVNYFAYDYPPPRGDGPFSVNMEMAGCPWNKSHRLLRIGLKGKEIAQDKRPPSNFVFLIDVSGSMQPENRLPLIKQALRMLVKRMTENDRIAMVVYASSSGVVLESTSCVNKEKILEAIDKLEAGGSTNGGEGIRKAYALAEEHFIKGGVNRVILATDGDFNVGITSQDELIELIQRKAKSGVFLSALGVGTDNYKDALLQKLADKGNGNYSYLDSLEEAQKVLIQQMNGTLVTIAKDVKIQIEFNPAQVKSYRLIGYEKRVLEAKDFNNDRKDAGEIGAGHTVTALYELVSTGVEEGDEDRPVVDDLKYQKREVKEKKPKSTSHFTKENSELLTLKLRYKQPEGDASRLSEFTLTDEGKKFSSASDDFRFAAAAAGFGLLLKDSEYKGDFTFERIAQVAQRAKGQDKEGYRAEFINLVRKAGELTE